MTVRDLTPPSVPEHLAVYFAPHQAEGRFHNPWGVNVEASVTRLLRWQTQGNPWRSRKRTAPAVSVDPDPAGAWGAREPQGRVCWLGHASLLVEIDGLTVLIDPVFGWAGPVPRKAPTPWAPADLPHVDVVAISHGHYDHLDAGSVKQLADRFGPDLVIALPLGLERSLPRAARPCRVVALDWWQALTVRGVDVCLVPAQHWHRRSLGDTNRAFWGGWVVRGSRSVYHSGDTGSFDGFAAIGHVFPDLDLAVLPVGAWEPRWFMGDQHMDPDGSIRAFTAVGAARLLAMHWGTFDLTDEPLDEGPDELRRAAERAGIPFDDRFSVLAHGASQSLRGD